MLQCGVRYNNMGEGEEPIDGILTGTISVIPENSDILCLTQS